MDRIRIFTYASELVSGRQWHDRYYAKLPNGRVLWARAEVLGYYGVNLWFPVGRSKHTQRTVSRSQVIELIERETIDKKEG